MTDVTKPEFTYYLVFAMSIYWAVGILLALCIHRWILSEEHGVWPPMRRRLHAAATKQLNRVRFPGKKSSLPSSSQTTPSKTTGDSLGNP